MYICIYIIKLYFGKKVFSFLHFNSECEGFHVGTDVPRGCTVKSQNPLAGKRPLGSPSL